MIAPTQSKSSRTDALGLARAAIGVAIVVAILAILVGLAASIVNETMFPDSAAFARAFDRVSPGMHHDEVIAALGAPDDQSTDFYLGQREGYEAKYEAAVTSRSKYFLVWNRGIDTVYTIGLAEDRRVAFKASGGT